MSVQKATAAEVIADWKAGVYAEKTIHNAISLGLFDWFCSDSKAVNLVYENFPKVVKLFNSPKLDATKYRISMKNPGRFSGPSVLYVQLVSVETNRVIHCLTFEENHWYDVENGDNEKTITEFRKYLGINRLGFPIAA